MFSGLRKTEHLNELTQEKHLGTPHRPSGQVAKCDFDTHVCRVIFFDTTKSHFATAELHLERKTKVAKSDRHLSRRASKKFDQEKE